MIYVLNLGADKQSFPLRLEYFRRADDAKPVRILEYSGLTVLGGKKLPTRLTMILPEQAGEFTRIEYRKLKFDAHFSGDEFSERGLR